MSGIDDFKISDTSGYKVADVVGPTLTGTVEENKETFDKLGLLIVSKYNDMIDYVKTNIINTQVNLDAVYPVGSIYMSVSATNPTSLFGGTWTQIKDKFLLCAGDTYSGGATGGSADAALPSHTHTITASSATAGAHKHIVSGETASGGEHLHDVPSKGYPGSGSLSSWGIAYANCAGNQQYPDTTSNGAHKHSLNITSAESGSHSHTIIATASTQGVSASGKNMPPYLTVYVWKRTA